MKTEIEVYSHKSVGPIGELYDHEYVVFLQDRNEEKEDMTVEHSMWTCLHCGYTDIDKRSFMDENCDRENNRVNTTVLEDLE